MRRPVGVKWVLLVFRWTRFFPLPSRYCRHPSIRTLSERLSLGASWAFSLQPVWPPVRRPLFHWEKLLLSFAATVLTFFIAGLLLSVVLSSTSITWERTASRRETGLLIPSVHASYE
jgi:hypothetical protein